MKNFFHSFNKNKKGIILIILSSIFVVVGQLLWKLSATEGIIIMILGFGFYGIGALIMLYSYKFGSLSVLQPFLSFSYVLSLILGSLFFNEKITANKVIGIIIILFGIILIGGGDE